jgi:hypothetical protein
MIALCGSDPLLVSAYDIDRGKETEIVMRLRECVAKGSFVIMDSGNYESYRKDDRDWSEHPEQFAKAFSANACDFAFCHDKVSKVAKGGALPSAQDVADQIVAATQRDIAATGCDRIMPIVHAPREESADYASSLIPEISFLVAKALRPAVLAIPERELGSGLIGRAKLVCEIRAKLDSLGWYQPIHLLGTGNPFSIALLCAAGADVCDGLEWCRTVIDRDTYRLLHFQHYEFFAHQAGSARTAIVREALEDPEIPYGAKVGFHNLEVFAQLEAEIQSGIERNAPQEILIHMFGKTAFDSKLRPALPEIFGR